VRTEDGAGRVAAVEILLNSPSISERIFKGDFTELKGIMSKSRELGMRTFDWALFELYNEGKISYEEAIRNADSANELRLNIKLKSERGEPAGALATNLELEHGPSEAELAELRRQELARQEAKRREIEERELAGLRDRNSEHYRR
jgi:twitching motility protein PilU